jgi:hypothetical protein
MEEKITRADNWAMFVNWFPEINPKFRHNVTFTKIEITMEDGSKMIYEKEPKIKVLFLFEKDSLTEVFAFFPEDDYNQVEGIKTCYAHIGQHSACHIDYAAECKPAGPEHYQQLKEELESIGYELEILNV